MRTINVPIPFEGTPEQAKANFASHSWGNVYDDYRCNDCDSKPSHEAALYLCGQEPPRADMEIEEWNEKRRKVAKSLGL
jgi:hypothetical protein